MKGHELHNLMLELAPAIVAMLRTGGAEDEDVLGIVASMLTAISIEAWPATNNEHKFQMIDIICEEAKTRLTLR